LVSLVADQAGSSDSSGLNRVGQPAWRIILSPIGFVGTSLQRDMVVLLKPLIRLQIIKKHRIILES
jgi:hypothetical protein